MIKNKTLQIRLTKEEKEQIEKKGKMANLPASAYLRNLGLGYTIESKTDIMAITQLNKAIGDLGRLGGLFKLWLSNTKEEWDPRLGDKSRFKVELLVREIEQNKQELLEIARRLL
ncbi:MAG: DNA transfer protein [Sulfurovaceae bacterium]|nr:DNA transfer protein [Sulfurovaceae bacterium]